MMSGLNMESEPQKDSSTTQQNNDINQQQQHQLETIPGNQKVHMKRKATATNGITMSVDNSMDNNMTMTKAGLEDKTSLGI